MQPINSAIEKQFLNYFLTQNIPDAEDRVYRLFNSGSVETPCVFLATRQGTRLGSPESGITQVPLQVRVVYVAKQAYDDPEGIDNLTNNVEQALAGAKDTINSDDSSDVFLFDLLQTETPYLEVVEHTYQYVIDLQAVAKKRDNT